VKSITEELPQRDNIQQKLKGRKILWIADDWNNEQFRNFIKKIDSRWEDGEVIHNSRNTLAIFRAQEANGLKKDIVVKKFNLKRQFDQLRFRFLKSKAVRSLIIAIALKEIGIKTPQPVAVFEERTKYSKIIYSYYLTEHIPYDYSLLDIIKQENHPYKDSILKFLPFIAQDIRKMHDAGIIHRDLHAGNILIGNIDNKPEFYYIDLNRARIYNKLDRKKRLKDLARFDFSPKEQELFLQYYAPENHRKLLDLLKQMRRKRERVMKCKRKLKMFFK
jgi:tRNA A-37 threonylcarbamoyl transferase component Bud32